MSDSNEPKPPLSPSSGARVEPEASDELDFESDALLDTLMFEEAQPSLRPAPNSLKLHEPTQREYSEDDVTVVGRTEDLLARFAHDDGTSGLEELASSEIDQLLSSLPPSPIEREPSAADSSASLRQRDVPAAPRAPSIQRPASHSPSFPRPGFETTSQPPAVNPAGHPARQPFPPAVSPEPPSAQASSSVFGTRPAPGAPQSEFDPFASFAAFDPVAPEASESEPSRQPAEPAARVSSNPALPVRAATGWPDERPAHDHLSGQRDAWITRAEWLENEAQVTSDAQAKARLLILASELWAMLGELPRARQVAHEASVVPRVQSIALRQLRALAAADGDFAAVAPALEMEIRGAATIDARVHAAYLSAELHRLALHDDAGFEKKLDLAIRAQQDDPRAHIAKLAELLGQSNAKVTLRWPNSEALRDLAQASNELSQLRGAPASSSALPKPQRAFDDARRALSSGEREAAAEALDRLRSVAGLGPSCAWLAASLRAIDPKTRGRAIFELAELAAAGGSLLALRALVTRALEHGDAERVTQAIGGAQGDQVFSAADRLALAALTGSLAAGLEASVWEVAHDPELRPLAAAFVAASSSARFDVLAGSEALRAEQRLAQALVLSPRDSKNGETLRSDARAFEAMHPESSLARLLALEFAKEARAKGEVAVGLADWSEGRASLEREQDQWLAAALLHELAAEHSSAALMYRRVLELEPSSEAALRALSNAVPGQASDLLVQRAETLGATQKAALALLEAALRGSEDESESLSLIERARDADPTLWLSYHLLELSARRRGDAVALVQVLRARRAASDDPVEQALDSVREALLIADSDLGLAERLLDEAQTVSVDDLALRELRERVAPGTSRERAAFREALAEHSGAGLRAKLLVEAALEQGRAGDIEAAARNAYLAAESSDNELWRVTAEDYAVGSRASARISEPLLERARATTNPQEQRELYERLSQIDQARGESSSALLWQTAILEHSPEHLPALRRLEEAYISGDRLDEMEPVAATLAKLLDPGEADAHARLAARLRVRRGAWSEVGALAELSLAHSGNELWALRALSAHARGHDDDELGLRVDERLFQIMTRPLDKATLALRAAEAAARLERLPDAERLLSAALQQVPEHLPALLALSEVLEASEKYGLAAETLERVAARSQVPAHQVSAWHQAAVLWLDKAASPARGRAALERAVALDIGHEDALLRLQALYVENNERQELAQLLERRLERTSDPEERIAIEVARGRALAEVGERDAAKAALAAALDANPDHAEALDAFAELCLAEGDWTGGEQALIRLARHVIGLPRQAQIYRRLGELYDTALPNPERAELAYKEVLKRDPDDAEAVLRLGEVYGRIGNKEAALSLQSELLARAKTALEKRDRTLALAVVEERIAGDRRRAELTFEKARKEWPHDSTVLRALVEFHRRHGETRAMQLLLDRAASDARRALGTGRFEPGFFEVLATVAELKHSGDAALVARATLAALYGEEVAVPAAGHDAGDARLDDLLAPELVSPPLRALLRKSGAVLDAAYPLDLRALRAAPLPASSAAFASYVQQVATAFGIADLELLASPLLGPVCTPVSSAPPVIVFGQSLLDSNDDEVRYFLLVRCLKIVQSNAAALSRTSAVELWPVLAAHLSIFAPNWIPQGVDGKKLSDAQRRIQAALSAPLDDDVPVLALEVIGAIGNRASLLGTALHQWGNRCALLSAGSLVASLRGVAMASGLAAGPPKEGPDRVKWIVRNPEARDLATFGVSEHYAEARSRLGLTRSSAGSS